MIVMELITGENDRNRRLDRILRKALPGYPLPLIHKLLRLKKVLVDGRPAKANTRLETGAKITIPDESSNKRFPRKHIEPSVRGAMNTRKENIDILWEGLGLIALNKIPGLAVHGQGSLDSIVQLFLAEKLPPSLSFKPGPLHRLDKPSSGIVVFSSNLEGARLFSSLMREHKIKKTYLAVVEGKIEKEEIWRDFLVRNKEIKKTFISREETDGSKEAFTKVTPISANSGHTVIKAEIETGRTHQIRAQAAYHGHPLAGDVKYGGKKAARSGQTSEIFLHAWKLEFLEYLIEAPLPESWDKWELKLK